MNVCLNARQHYDYLKRAQEIKFDFEDRKAIPNYIEMYPQATFIISMPFEKDIDWKELEDLNIISNQRLLLAVPSERMCKLAAQYNLSFYYGFSIANYYTLNAVIALGSKYVILDAPLFFEMDKIKTTYPNINIRAIPDLAYRDGFTRKNGIHGTWIRPEDIEAYEPYVSTIEFSEGLDLRQEQALFRLYIDRKEWPGDLQMIITNLNYPGVNRMIPPEITRRRITCGQKCQIPGRSCNICKTALDLAVPGRYNYLLKKKEEESNES